MGKPTVSVVIPVFNRTSLLAKTIESVVGQSFEDWEMIVVDDGSEEDVASIARSFEDERIACLRQAHQGNAAARNTGINHSRCESVICLDSDDIWHSRMLDRVTEVMDRESCVDVVHTQYQLIDDQGAVLDKPPGPKELQGDLMEALLMGYPILPSSALVRRSSFERWGAYKVGFDDWEMWLRWASLGCNFHCLGEVLLHYRIHDQNFNLDFDRRRTMHFAMLDSFYERKDLPVRARNARQRAYSNQHFYFAEMALMRGRYREAIEEYRKAVLLDSRLLTSIDHFTRLACAHQGRVDAGSSRGLDLELAESTLTQLLSALDEDQELDLEDESRIAEAPAWSYLSLARLAYGVVHDMTRTRQFLNKSRKAWPAIVWNSDWVLWRGRSAVGYRRLQLAKKPVKRICQGRGRKSES